SGLKSGGRFGSRWNKVGELTYNHAERFYNFRGLRQYKEKFNPTWESRYLAYSSKVRLPLLLKDLAIIISGGIKRMITK
ncbi:phosphatidylglycerol lysyltransferase domain-containing protein, partial [bacterium]|nr:phosphatidylglycerol lysyltransferase domain-containing protein [bacterium]